jgi:hypothetical protein
LPFWQAYLQAVDPARAADGASEGELYFNFALMFHPEELSIRKLKWTDDPNDTRLSTPRRGGLHGYCGAGRQEALSGAVRDAGSGMAT